MATWLRTNQIFATSIFSVCLALCLAMQPGCQPPAEDTAKKQIQLKKPAADTTHEVGRKAPGSLNFEVWDAVFISGHRVGHTLTREESVEHDGNAAVRTTQQSLIRVNRNNSPTQQKIQTTSLESESGEIIEFDAVMTSGISEMRFHGTRVGATQLQIQQTSQDGRTSKAQITIPPDCRGFFGTEQEMRLRPLSAGETRTIPVLAPIINAVISVEMKAEKLEETELIGEKKKLLRIEVKNKMPSGQTIPSTMWIDQDNEIVKSTLGNLQTNIRTSKQLALNQTGDTFDLGNDTMVSVSPPLDHPHSSSSIKYLAELPNKDPAELPNKDPAEVFANSSYQNVVSKSENEAIITVIKISPATVRPYPDTATPTAADKTANNMVQSNHALIRKMASRVLPSETDPWQVAVALEQHVHETVADKNFSTALASALEVANSKAGDCTEHSILLVALCRAREIPARAAIGLVYVTHQQAFGYHMWTEVWIADRWIPLDATLGQSGIGGAHLKVSHTNFSSSSGFESFLPVLDLMGKLKLSVLEQN